MTAIGNFPRARGGIRRRPVNVHSLVDRDLLTMERRALSLVADGDLAGARIRGYEVKLGDRLWNQIPNRVRLAMELEDETREAAERTHKGKA